MNSTQLDLWEQELNALPWRGQSPRGLTRVHVNLIFKPEAGEQERTFVDRNQLEMWPAVKKAPWSYQGAPLLHGGGNGNEAF